MADLPFATCRWSFSGGGQSVERNAFGASSTVHLRYLPALYTTKVVSGDCRAFSCRTIFDVLGLLYAGHNVFFRILYFRVVLFAICSTATSFIWCDGWRYYCKPQHDQATWRLHPDCFYVLANTGCIRRAFREYFKKHGEGACSDLRCFYLNARPHGLVFRRFKRTESVG